MNVIVPRAVQEELIDALRGAGRREIGGVLMGEHVDDESFAVRRITIQREGGSFASFIRAIETLLHHLTRFFKETKHNYRRFNYIGEWHSHPSFRPVPSSRDEASMREIVDDPNVGARFAVLLIVRLNAHKALEGSVTVYTPKRGGLQAHLVLDGESVHERPKS